MNDQRWTRIKALFQAAVERPVNERHAFVAAAAADDETVRREVESLLASDADHVAAVDGWSLADDDAGSHSRAAIAAFMADTPTSALLNTGSRIGSYEVGPLLGAGAMGEVYRARDTRLNRDVALKVLPRPFALDPNRLSRFRREAQVLAALNHPHIAAIYGFEESDGVQALVLELVEGATLADRLGHGPLPLAEVLTVGRQIAEAIEAAHEKGIIHRDLKPANIKIADNGAVKVLDFGLAKVWEATGDANLSGSSNVTATLGGAPLILGTAAYMSPEQARGKSLDKRTDIWSFGCVMFEMLTGRSAFAAETVSDTIARVLEGQIGWQALPPATPARLRELLRRCLERDAHRRLRDIGDARIEIDEMLTARDDAAGNSVADGPLANRRKRLLPIVAAAALVMIGATATAFFIGTDRVVSAPTFRELTFRHGTISGARLAADGQTVVYGATWVAAQPQLYVLRPESPQAGSIGLGNTGIYSVSSDGDLLVALGCRLNWGECLGTLAQVPITGGSPRPMMKDVLVADWAPDGRTLPSYRSAVTDIVSNIRSARSSTSLQDGSRPRGCRRAAMPSPFSIIPDSATRAARWLSSM